MKNCSCIVIKSRYFSFILFMSDFLFFFFFLAEDGIRGGRVTGVQACALPIFLGRGRRRGPAEADRAGRPGAARGGDVGRAVEIGRRRVGKECRSRWSRYQ